MNKFTGVWYYEVPFSKLKGEYYMMDAKGNVCEWPERLNERTCNRDAIVWPWHIQESQEGDPKSSPRLQT